MQSSADSNNFNAESESMRNSSPWNGVSDSNSKVFETAAAAARIETAVVYEGESQWPTTKIIAAHSIVSAAMA